jgi:hypothetical protein
MNGAIGSSQGGESPPNCKAFRNTPKEGMQMKNLKEYSELLLSNIAREQAKDKE